MSSRDGLRAAFVAVLCLVGLGRTPAQAVCDTTAPALTAFSFTPSSINTTSASQTVTCNMTLTDALSGVTTATCSFASVLDPDYQESCEAVAPTSGTRQNGTWSCVITFPRYSQSGAWTADLEVIDAVGNSAFVDPSNQGFPSTLNITSDPDLVAPSLTNFTLSPNAVTVSAAAQNVTCNMTLTDAKSGVAFAACQLTAPTVSSSQTVSCFAAAPTSGTRNNGVFSCVVSIPRYADAGTWTSSVFTVDQVFNIAEVTPTATLAVTSVPEDITVPSLSSFDFNPKTVSVGGGSKSVVCTMVVADSPAGVNTATCSFSIFAFIPVPPFDIVNQRQSCTASAPTTGTRNSGTFQCTVVLPRYAAGGMWDASATLDDAAGNSFNFDQALQLNVLCDAGDPETTCRFAANKTSLTWDAVAGANRYNVYRGFQTNLVDANLDRVPDGGYGTCQNSRDAVLTDTTFVDTDVPSVAQKGFFYLVSYTSTGVEKGLGANSFGTARTVTPCP